MALLGHSGSHAPQLMHSSVIMMAMAGTFERQMYNPQQNLPSLVQLGSWMRQEAQVDEEAYQSAYTQMHGLRQRALGLPSRRMGSHLMSMRCWNGPGNTA